MATAISCTLLDHVLHLLYVNATRGQVSGIPRRALHPPVPNDERTQGAQSVQALIRPPRPYMKKGKSSIEDVLCRVQVAVLRLTARQTRVFADPQWLAGFDATLIALFCRAASIHANDVCSGKVALVFEQVETGAKTHPSGR